MVGVPGRSKACHTCKMRKKGCDQQKPSCGQCTRSGLQCRGYDRARIFVNSSQEHGDANTCSFTPESYSMLELVHSKTQVLAPNQATVSQTVPLMLGLSLERTALESKYFEVYWSSLLPNGEAFTPRAAQYSTTSWIGVVQDLCQWDEAVRFALLTNALELVGQHSGQQEMIMEGRRMYGRSLHLLAKLLPARSQEGSDKLLATSGLLAAYELLQITGDRRSWHPAPTWLKHASGEKAIILARGPEIYVKGHAHRLFVDSRLHLIYPDIQNRRRSPFSSPKWKSIPWSLCPKDPKDELLDILVEIPGVLEDLEDLLRCPSDQVERQTVLRQQLEERCWLYDSQLQTWSTASGSSTVAFVEVRVSKKIREDSASSDNFAIAHLGMVYWATCNLLYHILHVLGGSSRPELHERIDPRQYCRKIVLMLPYFQSPGMGAFFMNIAGFPAAVAVGFLARQDPPGQVSAERRLLMKVFEGKHGRQLQEFLGTWPWETSRETEIVSSSRERMAGISHLSRNL